MKTPAFVCSVQVRTKSVANNMFFVAVAFEMWVSDSGTMLMKNTVQMNF